MLSERASVAFERMREESGASMRCSSLLRLFEVSTTTGRNRGGDDAALVSRHRWSRA